LSQNGANLGRIRNRPLKLDDEEVVQAMLDQLQAPVATPIAEQQQQQRPLTALLDDTVHHFPGHAAIEFLGRRWSYAELDRAVNRAARGLQEEGMVPGTRVGLCLPNTPYSVIFFFAVLRAGGIVVNFNPLYVERELIHQIADSGTEIMVTIDLEAVYPKVARVAGPAGLKRIIVCSMAEALPRVKAMLFRMTKSRDIAEIQEDGRSMSASALMRNDGVPSPVPVDPHGVAVLQYTGGTTGVPKAAELSHANLLANVEQSCIGLGGRPQGRDAVLGVLPLFHVFAMTCVMLQSVRTAARMILLPRFELDQVLKTIAVSKPTMFPAVPTIYSALVEAAGRRKVDMTSIQMCMSGGAPLPAEVRSRFMKLTGCWLMEGYGLSETSPVATVTPPDIPYKDGSVGRAVQGTSIEIRDPADLSRLLAAGERGEICIRGPQVMRGYWKRPDETRNVMIEGALRSGDVGYLDADGYLFLVDRIKDLIIAGGYNIYPRVLEEALYQHPAVKEAMVIGVPDAYRGQAPKAFVSLKEDAVATPEELRTFLAGYVSKIEMPREVEIRRELPKTMVGKLSKKELVAEEAAKASGK
jgi:long-chain acyl-CoA synthetase